MTGLKIIIGILVAALILVGGVFFTVDETEHALVLQFGKPIRTINNDPGLHTKLPFIQEAVKLDKRFIEYDANPRDLITHDKKALRVDNYALWRIVDPLAFYKSVRTIQTARLRLDDFIYSAIREELGKHTLTEIVSLKRDQIMETVTTRSNQLVTDSGLGIEVIDVRIKRADLPPENEKSVYDRMIAERRRMANQYRSEGNEESQIIRAGTDKEKTIILANAYRDAQITRGEGDSEAVRIYADAFERDPDFFRFWRSLDAYDKIIHKDMVIVLSPETEVFRYLKNSSGQ